MANTWRVIEAAHRIRDGAYSAGTLRTAETGDAFDLAIIGGGMSGLGAALYFRKQKKPAWTCMFYPWASGARAGRQRTPGDAGDCHSPNTKRGSETR